MAASVIVDERGPALALDLADAHALASSLQAMTSRPARVSVICCAQPVRLALARFVETCGIDVSVIGFAEVAPGYLIHPKETFDPRSSK